MKQHGVSHKVSALIREKLCRDWDLSDSRSRLTKLLQLTRAIYLRQKCKLSIYSKISWKVYATTCQFLEKKAFLGIERKFLMLN